VEKDLERVVIGDPLIAAMVVLVPDVAGGVLLVPPSSFAVPLVLGNFLHGGEGLTHAGIGVALVVDPGDGSVEPPARGELGRAADVELGWQGAGFEAVPLPPGVGVCTPYTEDERRNEDAPQGEMMVPVRADVRFHGCELRAES